MRACLPLAMVLIMLVPIGQGAVNPIPVLALKMDSANQNVNASAQIQIVVFNGTASVDKLPIERVVVELASAVDTGWASQISPAQMVFTSTVPQSFSCTVNIPAAIPGGAIAKLNVTGTASTNFLRSTASTQSIINVFGSLPAPANQTANGTNTTKAATAGTPGGPAALTARGTGKFLGLSDDQLMMGAAGAMLLVVITTAGGYARRARKRRAAQNVDNLEDA